MRSMLTLSPAAVLVGGCSRPKPSDTGSPEHRPQALTELDGTWRVVSIGGNGKTVPADRVRDMTVSISGRQFTTTQSGKITEQATVTTDPLQRPKTIDLAFTLGELKEQTVLGIYEVSGDTLRIAMAEPGQPRPTEIANRPGLRQDVSELRRE